MKAFIIVLVAEFASTDDLRVLARCCRGTAAATRGEWRRRSNTSTYAELLAGLGLVPAIAPARFRQFVEALAIHQYESVPPKVRSSAPIEIPGMSWGEAAGFNSVTIDFPAHINGAMITWELRKDVHVEDSTRGCALGVGVAAPDSVHGRRHVAAFAVYLQLHTGVFAVVLTAAFCETSGSVSFYWSLRLGTELSRLLVAPLGDDPVASDPSAFPHLVTVEGGNEAVLQASAKRECPSAAVRIFDCRDVAGGRHEPPIASFGRLFGSGLSTSTVVISRLREDYFIPAAERLEHAPPLFTHSKRFQHLQTPKGTYLCETGVSDVSRVNLAEAWTHTESRMCRYVARGWDKGLRSLWCEGLVPVGAVTAFLAKATGPILG
jgi:hypothetical protein